MPWDAENMRLHGLSAERASYGTKFLILVLIIAVLSGLISGVLSAMFFARPGPEGLAGVQGPQGEQGPTGTQGLQGIPGANGTNSVLQIVQKKNDTTLDTSGYTAMQWFNMSESDASMEIIMNIQQDSRVFAQLSMVASLAAPGSLWVRIVVDNSLNSSVVMSSVGPPSAGVFRLTSHTEFLTDQLSSGQHSIKVQFLREGGSPLILSRVLTAMELTSE